MKIIEELNFLSRYNIDEEIAKNMFISGRNFKNNNTDDLIHCIEPTSEFDDMIMYNTVTYNTD